MKEKKLEFRPLKANEVEARIGTIKDGKGCSLLLYKDARVDMQLLDETIGAANWQRKHEVIDGQLYCSVGIKFDGEWVWKQDVGVESNTEKEKGRASDSFKRACFNWGIGRELYTAPFIWISSNKSKEEMKYSKFNVTKLEVKDGVISAVTITDERGNVLYSFGGGKVLKVAPKAEAPKATKPEEVKVSKRTIKALEDAKEAILACKSRAELNDAWEDCEAYQSNKDFLGVVKEMCEKYPK